MLTLVGLGLCDEKDLSLRGLEEVNKADKVYLEIYTTFWFGDVKKLEELVNKEVKVLKRKDLEENSEKILEEAEGKNVVILVGGDPLVATTHSALILEAKKRNIKTKIIHNSSIFSAVAETGLHIYKFGPCVTIPFLEKTKGKLPESVYDVIKMNKARGLHTLCLLDIEADGNKIMDVREALEILIKIEESRRENVIDLNERIIVASRIGSEESRIFYEEVRDLLKEEVKKPAVLIIPGLLHFTEREFLKVISSSLHD
ncbi:MAG: diphthine synthase [Candidatus Aenigmatarchaeota archaeon]